MNQNKDNSFSATKKDNEISKTEIESAAKTVAAGTIIGAGIIAVSVFVAAQMLASKIQYVAQMIVAAN